MENDPTHNLLEPHHCQEKLVTTGSQRQTAPLDFYFMLGRIYIGGSIHRPQHGSAVHSNKHCFLRQAGWSMMLKSRDALSRKVVGFLSNPLGSVVRESNIRRY